MACVLRLLRAPLVLDRVVYSLFIQRRVISHHQGVKTIADLEKQPDLSNAQRIGIKYAADLSERIPRAEVDELREKVGADLRSVSSPHNTFAAPHAASLSPIFFRRSH